VAPQAIISGNILALLKPKMFAKVLMLSLSLVIFGVSLSTWRTYKRKKEEANYEMYRSLFI